jgi:SAM-dependent methyltransferase
MRETEMQNAKRRVTFTDAPPRPVVAQKSRYVPHSPQEEFIVPLLRGEIESCIAQYFNPAKGTGKAVDIGCGAQPFRPLLEQIGYSYCGVDVNSSEGVDVVCAADAPLPEKLLRRGPFDFLLCTEVIEHVADWHTAFENFARLLVSGGRALITAPHFFQLHEEPYDFWRPTLHAIDYYARRAGLEPLYRRSAGDAWDVLGTTLANCKFEPCSARLGDRALTKAIRVGGRLLLRAMLRRELQSRVRAEGPLYLSNVVVLEKLDRG